MNLNLTNLVATMASNQQGITSLNEQISTGKRVTKPADDPVTYVRALEIETQISRQGAYLSNMGAATSMLQMEDTALNAMHDDLQSVRDALLSAMNGTNSASDLKAHGGIVTVAYAGLLNNANKETPYGFLFSGYATTAPFTQSSGAGSYVGDTGVRQVQISDLNAIAAADNGQTVFRPGTANDLFALVQSIADALNAGALPANPQSVLAQVNEQMDHLADLDAGVGARLQFLQGQTDLLTSRNTTLQVEETTLIGVDTASAATQLSQRETQAQAMYQMVASLTSSQMNIFSYLKG